MASTKEWLIRKAKKHYVGPCDTEFVKKLIRESEISGYDEIARSEQAWSYIQDCPPFSILIEELVPHLKDEKTLNLRLDEITKVTVPGVKIPPPVKQVRSHKPVIDLMHSLPESQTGRSFKAIFKSPSKWAVIGLACLGLTVSLGLWFKKNPTKIPMSESLDTSTAEPSLMTDRPLEDLSQAFEKFNVLFFQAKLEEGAGEIDKAKELYQKAMDLGPPAIHMAKIKIRLLALELDQGRNFEQLKTDFLKILTSPELPKDLWVEVKNYLGLIELKEGKISNGIVHFQEVIQRDPHFSPAFFNLGYAYFFQKQYYEARDFFEKSVQLQPNLPLIYVFLGRTLQKLNKNDRAILEFSNANRINPNLYLPYLYLSFIHFKLNQRTQAFGYLEKMVSRDPEYDENSYKDTHYMQEELSYDFMIKSFGAVIKEKGISSTVVAGLGLLYFLDGKKSEAKLLTQKAIELKPEDEIAHTLYGYMLYKEGNFDLALQELQTALRFQYQNSLTHILIADILIKLGRQAEAIEHCRRVFGFDPYSVRAYHSLGMALSQLDRTSEAQEAFNKALEYDPNYIPSKLMLIKTAK